MTSNDYIPNRFSYVVTCYPESDPFGETVKINFVHRPAIGELIVSGGQWLTVGHVKPMTDADALPDPYGLREGNTDAGYAHND